MCTSKKKAKRPPAKIPVWAMLWLILNVMLIGWGETLEITKPTYGDVCGVLPETIRSGMPCYRMVMVEGGGSGQAGGSRSKGHALG